jgi:glycosyltransferase involved in cell wall biosynthesis
MPGKGQAFLIRAFALFKRRCPEAVLWLIGDGPDREMLERETQRLEVADSVRFWGQRPDVPSFLASSAIFAYASESEGMSNAVLEAMASGVPSVVVDAPGVTECHLPNVTGFVVERAPEAMAAKLDELATDPKRSRRMGAAARDHVRAHFSLEANRQRYLALYRRLTGSR